MNDGYRPDARGILGGKDRQYQEILSPKGSPSGCL
jgi:hypothetical protein